jgi:hypothetical protein
MLREGGRGGGKLIFSHFETFQSVDTFTDMMSWDGVGYIYLPAYSLLFPTTPVEVNFV